MVNPENKADIEIDGNFVGQTPLKLILKESKHDIKIHRTGYKPWTKTLQVVKDSEINIEAALEKEK